MAELGTAIQTAPMLTQGLGQAVNGVAGANPVGNALNSAGGSQLAQGIGGMGGAMAMGMPQQPQPPPQPPQMPKPPPSPMPQGAPQMGMPSSPPPQAAGTMMAGGAQQGGVPPQYAAMIRQMLMGQGQPGMG